jgi:hypothetical protein
LEAIHHADENEVGIQDNESGLEDVEILIVA